MTTYYVGSGGNNGNAGTSWALRKATLNGAEDIPVAAGDTVYVGPGTYRELLTVDVSGSGGSPITYIGDYTGANTDGVGGVVRITGSDNDQTATRASCITATTKHYRTFQNMSFDMATGVMVTLLSSCTDWTITGCTFAHGSSTLFNTAGATQARCTIQNCFFMPIRSAVCINFTHTSAIDNIANTVQNCIFIGNNGNNAINFTRVGGGLVRNCLFISNSGGIHVTAALTVGQTTTVNNNILMSVTTGMGATAVGEITEDYNTFFGGSTDRSNVSTGANSKTYPPLFDFRWFFELVTNAAGPSSTTQVISPFDLASFSQLVNLAGTSPTTTDIRGTAVQGGQREWGPLEYDSTLKVEGGAGGGSIFGGMVR